MTSVEKPVLVVADDDPAICKSLGRYGEAAGLQVIACTDGPSAIAAIDKYVEQGDLVGVVSDLRMPGTDSSKEWGGWEVLSHAYRASREVRLAVYTGFAGIEVNDVFRSGVAVPAFTMFEKPFDQPRLEKWIADIREEWDDSFRLTLKDADTRLIYEEIAPVYARSALPILLLGETGTGKESLAALIHEASGRRGPFVPINSGGLEPSLAFSELFGHTAGAFTDAKYHELGLVLLASGYKVGGKQGSSQSFINWLKVANPDLEERDGLFGSPAAEQSSGTLFLDEVATLPPKVMAGILRLLESGDVRPFGHYGPGIRSYCRILAATNEVNILRDSISATPIEGVKFRRDLCYRLGGAVITLSPLRERNPSDIRHYVEKVVWRQLGMPTMSVAPTALNQIVTLYRERTDEVARQYQLGNFRTLRNLAYRAALLADAENAASIGPTHVDLAIRHGELRVQEVGVISQDIHIRNIFRTALQEREVDIGENFPSQELTLTTRRHPSESGYAFLKCALVKRHLNHPKKRYYDFAEIEKALTHGMSRSRWMNKEMVTEHVRQAAIDYFEIEANDLKEGMTITDIVNKVRESVDARQPANRAFE
jgi:DNA-binding NtrC family response regulator